MPLTLRRLAVLLALALAGGCDPDFSPHWDAPSAPPPEAGEPGMDAGEEPDGTAETDAGGELDGGPMDGSLAPSDAGVAPVQMAYDCSVAYPCTDSGCTSSCTVPCRVVPCSLGPCDDPRECFISCSWCRGVIPATK